MAIYKENVKQQSYSLAEGENKSARIRERSPQTYSNVSQESYKVILPSFPESEDRYFLQDSSPCDTENQGLDGGSPSQRASMANSPSISRADFKMFFCYCLKVNRGFVVFELFIPSFLLHCHFLIKKCSKEVNII